MDLASLSPLYEQSGSRASGCAGASRQGGDPPADRVPPRAAAGPRRGRRAGRPGRPAAAALGAATAAATCRRRYRARSTRRSSHTGSGVSRTRPSLPKTR